MKKIALMCAMVMLLGCILSGITLNTNAAEAPSWNGWTRTKATVDGNTLVMNASAVVEKTHTVPSEYVAKFSMKVDQWGTNSYQGVYICNGSRRAGIYVYQANIHDFNGGRTAHTTNTGWHDYRLEVSGDSLLIYIDNNLVHKGSTQVNSWTGKAYFFTSAASGNVRVENFSITSKDGKEFAPALLTAPLETEYTPEFTTNWAESTEGWTITDCDEIFVNEKGNMEFNVVNKEGYFQVERAPKTTENFDVEFGLQIHEYSSEGIQFKAATTGYNNYHSLSPDRIRATSNDTNHTGGMGIQVDIGKEWHNWKIEVRGEFLTLYMDGQEVARYTMVKNEAQTPLLRFMVQGMVVDNYRVELGNVHYKPYFPEVNLTTPPNGSEYAESSNVTFKAEVDSNVDCVDYYVNGLNVGRGYAPNYEYVMKNAKVGTYRVSARIGDEKSVEHVISVVKGFEAAVKADRTEVNYGEAVNFTIDTEILNGDVKPVSAEYYADGCFIGEAASASFAFSTAQLKAGTTEVYAKIKNNNGAEFKTDSILVNVKTDGKQNAVFDREYSLEYDATADGASVEIADGYFALKLGHTGGKTTIETNEGAKEFALGKGHYRVDVTSGYAIVYYNGHLAFTALLPKSETANLVKYDGVEAFALGGTGVKTTVMAEKWAKALKYSRTVENLTHNYSIEFDKLDASDEAIVFNDGFYRVELVMKDRKLTTKTQDILGEGEKDFTLKGEVKPGYWRITVAKGLVQVWCDNVYVDSFAAPTDNTPALLTRAMSNPSASTLIAIKNTNDLFIHNEDFEGTTELDALDFWLPDETGAEAVVKNGAMELTGNGRYLLNGQSNDVVMKWQAKVSDTKDFYVTTRLFKSWYNMKLGYDYTKGKWYLHAWSKYGFYPQDTRTEFEGKPLTTDEWHSFELVTKEGYVELKCDGETVVKADGLVFPFNGYTGFGLADGKVVIDNVEYQGRCAVTGAVKNAVISDQVGIAEFYDDVDGAVFVSAGTRGYRKTTDNGETWSDVVSKKISYSTGNKIRLIDGSLFEIRETDLTKQQEAWVSADDGKTWKFKGYTSEYDGQRRVLLTGSITQASNGRVFLCNDHGYSEYGSTTKIATYYSDDLENWYISTPMNVSAESGLNLQEGSHVELPDGTIRWYARSGLGFIMYCESKDNGVTFGEWRPSQFIAPLCTYAVERDNEDPNTYWAIMQNDAVTYDYRYIHRPRNRFALMVSYDGMQSWEYVATLNEQTECPTYDACNHVLRVFDDTVYIQWNNLHTPRRSITYSIDKNKVRSQKRFEEIHPRFNWGMSSGSQTSMNCVLPKASGTAVIFGVNTAVDVQNGYDGATISKVFGAEYAEGGTFKMGDAVVTFVEGSTGYTVNGEEKTFGEVCLKNGYFNIGACAEAFGKEITETDQNYTVWYNAPSVTD